MHAPLDRPGRNKTDHDTGLKGIAGFLLLPVLITVMLVALAIKHPKSSIWISEAVEAEFGTGITHSMPTQVAEPAPLPQPTPVNGTIGSTQAIYHDQR